ncbi:MAG: hypothetical protein JJU00_06895 [Opitutales bacterium]|nr:hypothetical protein [Opitutales bacterium]
MKTKTTFWRFDNPATLHARAVQWHGAPSLAHDPAEGPCIAFGGSGDALVLPGNPVAGLPAFFIEARVRPMADGPEEQRFLHIQCDNSADRALLELRSTPRGWYGDVFLCTGGRECFLNDPEHLHPFGHWATLRLEYTGKELAQVCNGTEELRAGAGSGALGPGQTSVGRRLNGISPFHGRIAWIRFGVFSAA